MGDLSWFDEKRQHNARPEVRHIDVTLCKLLLLVYGTGGISDLKAAMAKIDLITCWELRKSCPKIFSILDQAMLGGENDAIAN